MKRVTLTEGKRETYQTFPEGYLIASRWELFRARLFGAVWEITDEGYTTRFIVWRGKTYVVAQTPIASLRPPLWKRVVRWVRGEG